MPKKQKNQQQKGRRCNRQESSSNVLQLLPVTTSAAAQYRVPDTDDDPASPLPGQQRGRMEYLLKMQRDLARQIQQEEQRLQMGRGAIMPIVPVMRNTTESLLDEDDEDFEPINVFNLRPNNNSSNTNNGTGCTRSNNDKRGGGDAIMDNATLSSMMATYFRQPIDPFKVNVIGTLPNSMALTRGKTLTLDGVDSLQHEVSYLVTVIHDTCAFKNQDGTCRAMRDKFIANKDYERVLEDSKDTFKRMIQMKGIAIRCRGRNIDEGYMKQYKDIMAEAFREYETLKYGFLVWQKIRKVGGNGGAGDKKKQESSGGNNNNNGSSKQDVVVHKYVLRDLTNSDDVRNLYRNLYRTAVKELEEERVAMLQSENEALQRQIHEQREEISFLHNSSTTTTTHQQHRQRHPELIPACSSSSFGNHNNGSSNNNDNIDASAPSEYYLPPAAGLHVVSYSSQEIRASLNGNGNAARAVELSSSSSPPPYPQIEQQPPHELNNTSSTAINQDLLLDEAEAAAACIQPPALGRQETTDFRRPASPPPAPPPVGECHYEGEYDGEYYDRLLCAGVPFPEAAAAAAAADGITTPPPTTLQTQHHQTHHQQRTAGGGILFDSYMSCFAGSSYQDEPLLVARVSTATTDETANPSLAL